jgi:small subunit ribosomal protein S6
MPLYESTFIARPDISSQQVDGLAEQFQELLRGAGGDVPRSEYWGLRSLAYRIKKNRKGHYYFMHIEAPPDAISEMERTMRINEDIIRYMTVRVDEFDPNPVPLTQSRGGRGRDRDSRGPGGRGGFGGREGRDAAAPSPDRSDKKETVSEASPAPESGGDGDAPGQGEN